MWSSGPASPRENYSSLLNSNVGVEVDVHVTQLGSNIEFYHHQKHTKVTSSNKLQQRDIKQNSASSLCDEGCDNNSRPSNNASNVDNTVQIETKPSEERDENDVHLLMNTTASRDGLHLCSEMKYGERACKIDEEVEKEDHFDRVKVRIDSNKSLIIMEGVFRSTTNSSKHSFPKYKDRCYNAEKESNRKGGNCQNRLNDNVTNNIRNQIDCNQHQVDTHFPNRKNKQELEHSGSIGTTVFSNLGNVLKYSSQPSTPLKKSDEYNEEDNFPERNASRQAYADLGSIDNDEKSISKNSYDKEDMSCVSARSNSNQSHKLQRKGKMDDEIVGIADLSSCRDLQQNTKFGRASCTNYSELNILNNVPKSCSVKNGNKLKIEDSEGARMETNTSVRVIQIYPEDEIHASPCQCALTLVGFEDYSSIPLLQSSQTQHGSSSAIKNVLKRNDKTLSSKNDDQLSCDLVSSTNMVKTDSNVSLEATHKGSNFSFGKEACEELKNKIRGTNNEFKSGRKTMTRTASTEAAKSVPSATPRMDNNRIGTQLSHKINANLNNNSTEQLTRVDERSKQDRQPSCDSKAEDNYHEITLIRCSYKCDQQKSLSNKDGITKCGYYPWAAITIRCSNHDMMDALIKTLKSSAQIKVVPFSRNPKARLLSLSRINNIRNDNQEPKEVSDCSSSVDSCKDVTHVSQGGTLEAVRTKWRFLFLENIEKLKFGNLKLKDDIAISFTNQKHNKKKNWNNYDHCEFCRVSFTLLNRRHHCRRCDRSCCNDCSSILLITGGEQTRYCNSCNSLMLLKQKVSEKRTHCDDSSSLPGLVHESCGKLGVGVSGKLPHWRNFITLSSNQRPAVGRLTVEIVQALALQPVDLNGKSDPYVHATVTGYDNDNEWNLQEWLLDKRLHLSSSCCSATLSPVWRGPGGKGGELLTLPVVSTCGAVLRLEVRHFDTLASAKNHPVLGVVQIPLCDIPNANLRRADSWKTKKGYDGFIDRWYQLEQSYELDKDSKILNIVLAEPIENPLSPKKNSGKETVRGKSDPMKKVVESLDEIGKLTQRLCSTPVEWMALSLGMDVPRHATFFDDRCPKIHVRLKLNSSEAGDLMSHCWDPPVRKFPEKPAFDPDVLLNHIIVIGKHFSPYHKGFEFCDALIKWQHPTSVCVKSYLILIIHIYLIRWLLVLLHLYLVIFLAVRLRRIKASKALNCTNKSRTDSQQKITTDENTDISKNSLNDSVHDGHTLGSGSVSKDQAQVDTPSKNDILDDDKDADETARLNKAIYWLAKRWGDNRGLETLQFKMGVLSKDIANINSVWDGSNRLHTEVAIWAVIISFFLQLYVNLRLYWILVITVWYFGSSPQFHRFARIIIGFNLGITKIIRRRALHQVEANLSTEID